MKRIVGYGFLFLAWLLNGVAIISDLLFGTLQSSLLSLLRSGLYILLIIGGVHHFWSQSISNMDDLISDTNIKSIEVCVPPENPFPPDDHDDYGSSHKKGTEGGRFAGFAWRSSIEAGPRGSACVTDDRGPSFEDGCVEYERQADIYEACERRNR